MSSCLGLGLEGSGEGLTVRAFLSRGQSVLKSTVVTVTQLYEATTNP